MNVWLWNSLGISAPADGMRDCEGEWEKQLLVRAKNINFTPYLVFSPLWRCVALGAKGHLRWQKKTEKQTEREWVILAAGLQNASPKDYDYEKTTRGNAYHPFIMLAFKEESNMAMRCFPCLVVQAERLSRWVESVWLLSTQLLAFYPDY